MPDRKIRLTKSKWMVISAAGLVLLMIAAGFLYAKTKYRDKPSDPEPLITTSTTTPDESKSNADSYQWRGAADEPKKLRIPELGVDTFIQKLGVDQDDKVATPNNVHLAGWFSDAAKPGQRGLSVLVGHVSGLRNDGVFKRIGTLEIDDMFEVENGEGSITKYKVISTKQVPEAEAAAYLFSQEPNVPSQLNLITCAGAFNAKLNTFPDRLIVQAEAL